VTYFGMVTTAKSARYTGPALESFFRFTELGADDRFFLIDNDGGYAPPAELKLDYIANSAPMSFAANVNQTIARALPANADVVFLNNDIIFSPDWLPPLKARDDAILVPLCNQNVQYEHGGLVLKPAMDIEEYAAHEDDYLAMVAAHRADAAMRGMRHSLLIPLFCFRLPHRIMSVLGPFDEGFGTGGGEDIDYRVRAHVAGLQVLIAAESYVLHFGGKSTWRSGEVDPDTKERDNQYRRRLIEKWGLDVAALFLTHPAAQKKVHELGLGGLLRSGDYPQLTNLLLARRL
jgi:hypothetical protein